MTVRMLGLMASCILLVTPSQIAYAGFAVRPEVTVGRALGESLRRVPDLGENGKRSAVVVNEPRFGQQQILSLTQPVLTMVTDASLLG
ncbi:hypothetical protein NDU88_003799 [Pleurodeles waltl]|uniref:Uncharacterized protein n=1 Tax=Pleurodeles waltl TaxID=8319 RepID=A0AAV7T6A9_PLEWA|nr:hypothetical protein NDU88_003799 [Pleurodeles waltl]